jgi:cell division septal protein FtsQ
MDRPLAARVPPSVRLTLPWTHAGHERRAHARPRLPRPRVRRVLIVLAVCACVLAAGWLWLRHSSLVAVHDVRISGVSGPQSGAIDAALLGAAHRMSTLDVNDAALRAAVAPFRVVRAVQATPSFPHGLRIVVVEQPPVAALQSGGTRTAVAADGVVLGPALLRASLPALSVPQIAPAGGRVTAANVLACLAILGAAPGPLRAHIATVAFGSRGVTITMGNGLVVYFGDGGLAHAKWLALARVLVDPNSAGAGYVDVRLPSRPAAGFAPGTGPTAAAAAGESAASSSATSSESAVSSIAAGLAPPGAAGAGGSPTQPSGTGTGATGAAGATGTPGASAPAPGVQSSPQAGGGTGGAGGEAAAPPPETPRAAPTTGGTAGG